MSESQLWAPWRLGYIVKTADPPQPSACENLPRGADPGCFICRAVASSDDADNLVVERAGGSVTILNRFPYSNGHLLICPQLHLANLDDLSDQVHLDLMSAVTRMTARVRRRMNAEGFNVGLNLGRVAGAGLPGHLHWHVVPRWSGDTNFMPVLADANVIPQSLAAAWELLSAED